MPAPLLPDALWSIIEPLLPPVPARPRGSRPPVPARATLTGILFVLGTGIPWKRLPQEMGCGSGVTCWRRLRDWQRAGVWDRLHRELLRRLRDADRIDWSRACLDSSSVAAKKGGGDRAQSHGPRQARHQTPPDHRSPRRPARLSPDRRQRPRQRAVRGADRRRVQPSPASGADHGADPTSCTPTRPMTLAGVARRAAVRGIPLRYG